MTGSATQLIDLLTYTFFDLFTSTWYIKCVAVCHDIIARKIRELKKEDKFRRALVRGGIAKKDGCGSLYTKNVTEVLQEHIKFAEMML